MYVPRINQYVKYLSKNYIQDFVFYNHGHLSSGTKQDFLSDLKQILR